MTCWRHDLGHREYICRCESPVDGDTGYAPGEPCCEEHRKGNEPCCGACVA